MRAVKQSAARTVMVYMVRSDDHVTGMPGLTLTVSASKAGGAFATISPTVTDRGNGWYSIALTSAHTDTLGDLAIMCTATGADPALVVLDVVAYDPADSTRLGLAALPNAAAASAGGIITSGSGSHQLTVASGVAEARLADGVDHGGSTARLRLGSTTSTPAFWVESSAGDAARFIVTAGAGAAIRAESTSTNTASRGVMIAADDSTAMGIEGTVAFDFSSSAIASMPVHIEGKVLGGGTATITGTGARAEIASGGITSSSFATDAITASAIAADAIGSSELAATAASEIATAVRTELTTELARIDVAVSTRASSTALTDVRKLVEADLVVDTTPNPWELVWIEKGTGPLGTGTELMRKKLYDVTGAGLTAQTTIVGGML